MKRTKAWEEYYKKWKEDHPDYYRNYTKQWKADHPDEVKIQVRKRWIKLQGGAQRRDTLIKTAVMTFYGGGECACVRCGFSDLRALCLDHIRNNGSSDRKNRTTGSIGIGLYSRLQKEGLPRGEYQTLCANCNTVKQQEHLERVRLAKILSLQKDIASWEVKKFKSIKRKLGRHKRT